MRTRTAVTTTRAILRRRSSRINLSAPVRLSGQDQQNSDFKNASAKATNLNRHGAAIQFERELSVGSTLVVRNMRGTQLNARVVAQVGAVEQFRTYGIEFVETDAAHLENFWGIAFPPKA
jgi:PilZ domain